MKLFKKIGRFFKYVFSYFKTENNVDEKKDISDEDAKELQTALCNMKDIDDNGKIVVYKKTLMTRLYSLEQTITVLQNDYPNQYNNFMNRIEEFRQDYIVGLEESQKDLTFEIDPDLDYEIIMKVVKLEKDIKKFIDEDMRFDIISKRLQQLILKLNILYNTSIYYYEEKSKVISQVQHALEAEEDIIKDVKGCKYILNNKQLKERIISLVSYTDYLTLKIFIRNSDEDLETIINNLAILKEFNGVDYIAYFKDYILDEVSDLNELLPLIKNTEINLSLKLNIDNLLKRLVSLDIKKVCVFNLNFWTSFFKLETSMIEMLKQNGVSKDEAKVKVLTKMNIKVNECELFTSPKTNAILDLSNIKDTYFINKFLNSISDNVTYKEIYFLLVLFNLLDKVKTSQSGLAKKCRKYIDRYVYTEEEILNKKEQVFEIEDKEYIFIFNLNKVENDIVKKELTNCNLDYIIQEDKLYINSFYFKELNNISKDLNKNKLNGGIIYG